MRSPRALLAISDGALTFSGRSGFRYGMVQSLVNHQGNYRNVQDRLTIAVIIRYWFSFSYNGFTCWERGRLVRNEREARKMAPDGAWIRLRASGAMRTRRPRSQH